ncbi:MAG: imidazolonepropionase [Flavobacteriia bacterium]|nr:imidazolonepropionase [Flavobacteriia bacterium]
MSRRIYVNIKGLVQVQNLPEKPLKGKEMARVPMIENAFLVLENDAVVDFGPMGKSPSLLAETKDEIIDLEGRFVLPAFCDSHTHAVFAAPRESEFVDKINGLSYEEIAKRGGGILNSAKKVDEISESALFEIAKIKIEKIIQSGTGAVEIKSGYGLNLENELKILRVIRRLKNEFNIPIRSTFLAAHALPLEFKTQKEQYINRVVNEWIPKVAQEKLADYVDVFCETGYFSTQDMDRIFEAAIQVGMLPKAHVNQFNVLGGVTTAIQRRAVSVDHLEYLLDEDIEALSSGNTMPTFLPGCSFYLGLPYGDARALITEGLPVCLASDFNPGSSPNYNMFFIWSLACIKMKLSPEEAYNAMTINAAFAMGVEKTHGSIFKGYKGKLIVTPPAPSFAYFPYAFGENHVECILN